MLNKMLRVNKSVTESVPKFRSWTGLAVLTLVLGLALIGVSIAVFMEQNRNEQAICTVLSSEQSQEEVCVELELVSSREALTHGLSGRENMSFDEGMLFDFQSEGEHCMWMKDMNFSLDMIWLNQDGQVVNVITGIHPDTYPDQVFCNETTSARYVIEVNAGVVESANIVLGQQIQL